MKSLNGKKESQCADCGITFRCSPSDQGKYCSRACYWKNASRIKTQDEKDRISVTLKRIGHNPTKFWKRGYHPHGMLGKKMTLDTRKKMSNSHRERLGEKWMKGYKYRSERKKEMARLEYRLWREAVFLRDDFTCKFCGERGGKIQADHIKPWNLAPDRRYDVDNGRTLCVDCHRKTETWGSKSKAIV